LFFLVFKVGVTDLHETDPNCTDQILAPDRSDYPDYHFQNHAAEVEPSGSECVGKTVMFPVV